MHKNSKINNVAFFSSDLFILYNETILREQEKLPTFIIARRILNKLRHTDDIVFVAGPETKWNKY